MGLDVYVGTLTRYYSGEWATVIQQMGAIVVEPDEADRGPGQPPGGASGNPQQPVGPPSPPAPRQVDWVDRIGRWLDALSRWGSGRSRAPGAPPVPVADAVAAWRVQLNEQLAGQLAEPLSWDESATAPYFTDKPGWVGYACLLLLAAHDEYPEHPRPTQPTDDWSEDPAWKLASRDDFAHSRYGQILRPSIWLPSEFARAFAADDLTGEDEVEIGSSVALVAQLRELNERTYQGSPEQLAEWLYEGPYPGAGADQAVGSDAGERQLADVGQGASPFDHTARFVLALFLDLAEKSVTHRLPMKLDW
jgi:hypothetical protein